MKALVKKYAEEGLWLEDVPIPEIAGNEVLIKIHKTAMCGTDVHLYNWDDWMNIPNFIRALNYDINSSLC